MTRDRPGKYHLYHEAVQATWLGLVVNLLLGCAKLAGGLVGRSHALISDAVNSLGDVFTSVAVLLAFRVAQKPADAEHPYGHTRAEAIAGSNVAVLVIVSALLVGWGALQGFSPARARGSARLDAGHCRVQRRDQGSALPVQDPAGPSGRIKRDHCERLGPPGRRLQRPGCSGRALARAHGRTAVLGDR